MSAGEMLRSARRGAGLTQVELARRSGVAQSVISAYENDRRDPTCATLDRLLRACGRQLAAVPLDDRAPSTTLLDLRRRRRAISDLLARHGAHRPRVFGSVARGTDDPARSDIDLLVDLDPDVGLVGLIRLERELSELLGRPVDLVPASSLKDAVRDRALDEAVDL